MANTVILWQHEVFPEQTVKIDLPLTSKIDAQEVKSDLGLPDYLDLGYFPLRKAVIILWACKHANELHKMYPNIVRKEIANKPIRVLLFGGAGIKICCPSANAQGSPFNRTINDVDLLVNRKQCKGLKNLLLSLGDIAGTMYFHFVTPYEERYNTIQVGRLLLRTFNGFPEGAVPTVGLMDILSDQVEMRHTVDVKDDLEENGKAINVISPHNLLLTKLQYILDLPKKETLPKLEKYDEMYRVLPYEHFDESRVLIGMEAKDLTDVACLLLDHDFGDGAGQTDLNAIRKKLKDNKFRLTVRLNLQNMVNNLERLRKRGATESDLTIVRSRAERILQELPKADYDWSRPWWNIDVETPETGVS
jgi:hypothetical protein